MAEKNARILNPYALPFAAWEMRLYLNSHPEDHCALRLYDRLIAAAPEGNYASIALDYPSQSPEITAGALGLIDSAACLREGNLDEWMQENCCCCDCAAGDCCSLRWPWIDDPWPWDRVE